MFKTALFRQTPKTPTAPAYRLEAAIQRSEFAFQTAEAAERNGNTANAEHFLEVAIREEAAAFQ
jgi:hypothetical protein